MLRWLVLLIGILAAAAWVERDVVAPHLPAPLASLLGGKEPGEADASTGRSGKARGGGAPTAVETATAASGSLPVLRRTIGTILPVASTVMTSETTGTVASLAVGDGAEVRKGDLLVSLDERTARAQIGRDEAAIERDQVTLDQAERDLKRAEALVKSGAFTAQQGEDAQSAANTAAAVLRVDRAALAADTVALDKLKILAPFDGRLGAFDVSVGALVTPGTAIVRLTQTSPVYAAFTLAQEDLALVRESMDAGTLTASLVPAGAGGRLVEGKVAFLDNAVDTSAGSVALRATIDNPDGALVSGQSISVTVKAGDRDGLVLVPTVSVQPRQDGRVVYVVKDDDTVTIRPVEVAIEDGDRTGLIRGLQPGERVVTEGQGTLQEGAKVKPGEGDAAPVAEAEGGAATP